MKFEHKVTRKSGYITNRIYNLGTRDKHETWPGDTIFLMKNDIILSIWDIARIYFKKSIHVTLKLI